MRLRARRKSPRIHHQPLTLERLEDRTLLSGDLLITAQVPGSTNYLLMQYTQQGDLVNSQPIPQGPGATESEDARGLSVDPSGNVNIFDGTQSPSLATLSSTTQNWLFQTAPGWGTGGNITYGNVAAYKNYIFASDMQSSNGQPYGIVRFDSAGDSPVFAAPGSSFVQLALGQDGLLYGLEGTPNGGTAISQTVEVFNPDTLAPVRTFSLTSTSPSLIRSIAVDGAGNVFAATWGGTVAEYDKNGNSTGASVRLNVPGFGFAENLMDIALDTDGQIAVGGRDGDIFLTDESLANVQAIQTNQANVFVTFDHYIGAAPQIVTPSFSALAGPTITYGQSTVTLGGTISANSAYPPGSVNITLDGVTQAAAIDPTDGSFSAVFNTSTLGVSGSPYTITYSYAGQNNYASITDTTQSLTVNQAVTTLSNLSSPTIVYGTPTATFSGLVGSNSILPVGQDVTVTLLGANGPVASGSGTIGSNGQFSVSINTAALTAGTYAIEYSYAGDENFTAVSDTSKSLTINQATTTLSNLSSPTMVVGTSSVAVSGTVGSNSVLPVGQSVTVTLLGSNGALGSGSGVIGSDGSFSVTLSTGALPAGSYTIQYAYAGDANFQASNGTGTLQVSYAVTPLYNTSTPVNAGAAKPIMLRVTDAAGNNVSSADLTVTAMSLVGPDGQTYTPQAKGDANPGNVFRNVGFGYLYNLDTTGLAPGTYTLLVKVGNDPVLHALSFVVASSGGASLNDAASTPTTGKHGTGNSSVPNDRDHCHTDHEWHRHHAGHGHHQKRWSHHHHC